MNRYIEELLQFGLDNQMIETYDLPQSRNLMMALLKVKEPFTEAVSYKVGTKTPSHILEKLLEEAVKVGIIEDTVADREILDAKLMATMMPRQSELIGLFQRKAFNTGIESATDYFYALSQASNYIRMDRISKNMYWEAYTVYGNLEITVNLSKPEKDPKEIAAAKLAPQSNYPKCLLCLENVGFEGTLTHPARTNHRVIPVTLNEEQWYFQYSPYVYYNEHAIVFKEKHEPMVICKETFKRLLDFIEMYPHYFLGSNADLPIVGGSILSHDHFQGGHHQFPMAVAEALYTTSIEGFEGITVSLVKWPLSVIRIAGKEKATLVALSDKILEAWRGYSDEELGIHAYTKDIPHNTITPIARMNKGGLFELDLVLRNNRQSEEHPDGIFHPHQHLHHIKKENIGLIEVMGLAVLPARLKTELGYIEAILTSSMQSIEAVFSDAHILSELEQHKPWIQKLIQVYGTKLEPGEARKVLEDEVGRIFNEVLECAGVYKQTSEGIEGMKRFVKALR